jgi:GT2 family glycosyltransferase
MPKELSIILPAYNNRRITASCLAHIFQSSYPKDKMQIIFIDNGCTDKTETLVTYLVEQGEPITYIKIKENIGYISATNQGWKSVDTPHAMLLNNDVYMNKTCIVEMMNIMKSSNDIGIVGGMEYLPNGYPSKVKPFIFFDKDLSKDNVLKDYKDLNIPEDSEGVEVEDIGFACVIIKKDVWKKIGYYDEIFSPCMFEQEDYCLRAKQAGFKIVLATKAKFTHLVGATTAFNQPYYQQFIKINKQKFLNKWKK